MGPHKIVVALLLAGMLAAGAAAAGEEVAREEGRALAERRCSMCHATGREEESPHRASPPFRIFHESFPIEMLTEALRTGVVSGHDEMPMFELSPVEIRALLTYIDSLAPNGPRYIRQQE